MTVYQSVAKVKRKAFGRKFGVEVVNNLMENFVGKLKDVVNPEILDIKTVYKSVNKFGKDGVGKTKKFVSDTEITAKNGLFSIRTGSGEAYCSDKFAFVYASLNFHGTTDKEKDLYMSLRKLVKEF